MDPKHEQTANEASPRRARGNPAPEPNPQAEMKIHRAEDDVLNVIESVESQIAALRKAHEEHRAVMADLARRKRDLETQTKEVENRETELTSREVELAEMRQDFEAREQNLIQRASGLEQRESKIASQAEMLEQQEADLETQGRTLESKIQELDQQLAGLAKRKAELSAIEEEVRGKLARESDAAAKLETAISELEETRSKLGDMSEQLGTLNHELLGTREAHKAAVSELEISRQAQQAAAAELKATVSKLRGREIELAERSHTLEELAEKTGDFQQELTSSRAQYEQQLRDLSEKLDREQKVTEGLRAQLENAQRQHEQHGVDAAAQINRLSGKLDEATASLQALRAQASEQGAQSDDRARRLAEELEESRAAVGSLTQELAQIQSGAQSELSSEREKITALEAEIESFTGMLEEARSRNEELTQKLEVLGATPQSDPEELESLRAQLDASQAEAGESAAKLEETYAALRKMQSELESRDGQAQGAQRRIDELENQSSELFSTIEELSAELEKFKSGASSADAAEGEWTLRRRDRLKRMRKVLAGDAEKVRRATEALRTRYDQCEQVLMKRAELAEAYEAIATAQRKYQKREVRSGVFLGLIALTAITLVIAATSWFISGRMAPGVYAAKATMAAASGDSKLRESDMAQWEAYITGLAQDPRFLEIAAERMKRRGITEFAVPGDLAVEMNESLDIVASMPGSIVLEYRGEGAQRAQRILDTFTVALSSAANNARARRADSALTTIEEPAQAGPEPLDTKRIEQAGMIFGGGMLLTLLAGGLLWGRLSAAKARFENDSRVENLLDESQWQLPG